jgi:prenyltransferase beta subunit
LEGTVRFLQNAQNLDGGFGASSDTESNQDFSAWVAFALAADGINPQDQSKPGGVDAYTYLAVHAARALVKEVCEPVVCTTSFERELLVVDAAGTSQHDFGGIDLVGELLARGLPDGSFPFVPGGHGEVNDTIFAILSLSPVLEPAAQNAVKHATEWLITQQNADGSWSAQSSQTEAGEVDMTGAALQALSAAGLHGTSAQQRALKYLHEAQALDGGFPELPAEKESNAASTAWAVQGLWATGENPETWVKGPGREPLDYMESLQQPDGHIRFKASEELNGVWMTAYVAPAFAGQALPISAVPRAIEVPTASQGPGVIAGGGGDGAPLFSRPQPQSKGSTPGGVRLLGSVPRQTAHRVRAKHRRDPSTSRQTASIATADAHEPSTGRRGVGRPLATRGIGGSRTGEKEVKGILIGAAGSRAASSAIDSGAPGLRSGDADDARRPSLAVGIAAALLLSALLGAQLERRRPEAIL